MGLMDAFTADERVELKVGELYDILRAAASNEQTARFLMNAVKNEVPYKYIREVITGEKEEDKEIKGICIEIPRDILDVASEEAKKAAREAAARLDLAAQGTDVTVNTEINAEDDGALKDCAAKNVSCEECSSKDICNAVAQDAAGMADETDEGSEGGEE